jgi:hypothetical protein
MGGRLLRLAQELSTESAVAARLAVAAVEDSARLEAMAAPADAASLRGASAALALTLHRWYSAFESMLERIERVFGTLPSGPEWHRDLLEGAAWPIDGVRPAIVPPDLVSPLRELLAFRHFIRHAYAVELDPVKLRPLADALTQVAPPLQVALTGFIRFLRESAKRESG